MNHLRRTLLLLLTASACGRNEPLAAPEDSVPRAPFEALVSALVDWGEDLGTVVYVSMRPGTIRGAALASIRNLRTKLINQPVVMNGGFDPRSLSAVRGDRIEVVVRDSTGHEHLGQFQVPERPVFYMLRTVPAPQATEVPLDAVITLVFSEPVDLSSIDPGAIGIWNGTLKSAPTRFAGGPNGKLEVVPEDPLDADATYALVVGTSLRGLGGASLGSAATITFTTGPRVASVFVEPSGAAIYAGRTVQLKAVLQDRSYNVLTGRQVTWSTSDPSVASVSASGIVTGLQAGAADIRAESEGKAGVSRVTILAVPTASIQVTTVTTGTDLDIDGYFISGYLPSVTALNPRRIGLNGSVTLDSLAAPSGPAAYTVWLTDVDPNCSVADDYPVVTVAPHTVTHVTFTVSCEARAAAGSDPLVGVWEAVRYEFFRDSAFTSRFEDHVEGGVAGTLILRTVGSQIRWQYRETYRWYGPDLPTLIGGTATVAGDTLRSAEPDRWATEFECDLGDCGGPLHGDYPFVRNGDELVITRLGPVHIYFNVGLVGAWMRLTLRKVR